MFSIKNISLLVGLYLVVNTLSQVSGDVLFYFSFIRENFYSVDAYSFDPRNREVWDVNWRDTGTNSNLVAPKNYESVGF